MKNLFLPCSLNDGKHVSMFFYADADAYRREELMRGSLLGRFYE
jgi:hypothetical protein